MKIRKISTFLALSFGAVMAFSGCDKDDGPIPKNVKIIDVPTITTNLDVTGSLSINLLNLPSFTGKFKVDNYFPSGARPTKIDISVRKTNGTVITNNNVKLFKSGITTLPANITVTAAEIVALFGPMTLGDNYDFGPDIYLGDNKYEAFPAIGIGTGVGHNGQPLYSEFARFSALCAYDPAIYQGNFVVTQDAWADFSVGDVVAFTQVSATSFSFLDPFALNPTPIIVTVNAATNAVTIAKQKIGSSWGPTYSPNPATYPNPWLSGTGSVAPCSKSISLTMTYGYRFGGVPTAETTFAGTWALSLVKQ